MSALHTLKKVNKNKTILFQPSDSRSGSRWQEPIPAARGARGTHSRQDALPSQGHPHTPTQMGTMQTHRPLTCSFCGVGGTWSPQRNTQTRGGRSESTLPGAPPGIDFFYQHCSEMTLSEDLLYMERHV